MADEQRSRGQGGPISDIERFLMEVERLRKKSAEEKRQTSDSQGVDEVEVVRPAPRRAPPPSAPRQAPPQRRQPQRPRPRQVVEAQPVLEAQPARPAAPQPTAIELSLPTQAFSTEQASTVSRSDLPVSLAIQQVASMLRTKHQLRASIIISEILSPPLSKRRLRGRHYSR